MERDLTIELAQARLRFSPTAIVVDAVGDPVRLKWTELLAVTREPDALTLCFHDSRLQQRRLVVERNRVGDGLFASLAELIQRVWHVSPSGCFVWIRHEHEARHHWIDGGALYRVGDRDALLEVPWAWSLSRVAWLDGMLVLEGLKYPNGSMAVVRLVIDCERRTARVERDEQDAAAPVGELSFPSLLLWLESVDEDPIAVSIASSGDHQVQFSSDGPERIVVDYDYLGISVQRTDERVFQPWSWIRNVQELNDSILLNTRQRLFGKLHFKIERSALPDRFDGIRARLRELWVGSPNREHAWVVRSDEVRMSHWIHSGALWGLHDAEPLFTLATDWDAMPRWQDDQLLVLRARKYPGGSPCVTLTLDVRSQTAIVKCDALDASTSSRIALPTAPPGPIPFAQLPVWLDAYPGSVS